MSKKSVEIMLIAVCLSIVLGLLCFFSGCKGKEKCSGCLGRDDHIASLEWRLAKVKVELSEAAEMSEDYANELADVEDLLDRIKTLETQLRSAELSLEATTAEPNTPLWGEGNPPADWQKWFGNDNGARLDYVQTNEVNRLGQAMAVLAERVRKLEVSGAPVDLRVNKKEGAN